MRLARFLAVLFLVGIPGLQAGVIVNEVLYHPPEDDDSLQFIELQNPDKNPVSLRGWKFTKGIQLTLPEVTLAPGEFGVVCRNTTALQRAFGTNVPILGEFRGKLKHGGERIELTDASGRVVDSLKFDDRAPWPTGADGNGSSLERITPFAGSEDPHNWAAALPTDRQRVSASPGKTNSVHAPGLPPVIEEVRFQPPAPNVPTAVTAVLRPEVPIQVVELRYQSFADTPGASETVVAMKPTGTRGIFAAEIPAQPSGRLLRFRIRAVGTNGIPRFEPAPGEPCPTYSAYLMANTNRLTVPSAILLPIGPKEAPGSSLRHRTRGGTPPVVRGQSAFIYFPTNGAPVQTFDHIRLTPRAGGWKVRLHKDRALDEMTTLNLVYEHQPRWVLSEPLGYELFRKSGIPTPKTGHLRLWLQGRPMGYHLMVEQPNASFLRRNQRDTDGNLYKLLWYGRDLVGQHEKKNNPETGHTDLVALVRSLQSGDSAAQWELIQREFNVDELCNYFAVGMCIQNWDGFFNNYFAYHAPGKAGKWEMFPWDLDKTWGDYDGASSEFDWYEMPLTYGMKGDQEPGGRFNLFRQRNSPWGATAWWRPGGYFSSPLLANPEFRRQFLKRLRVLCDTVFTEKEFLPVIDSLERRLEPEVRYRATIEGEDPGAAAAAFHDRMESFRRQLKHRRAFILQELGRESGGK